MGDIVGATHGEDLGEDEVWQCKEEMLLANREKLDKLKKRLEQQKRLAEEKLIEEQEKMLIAKMENEIKAINQKRFEYTCRPIDKSVKSKRKSRAVTLMEKRANRVGVRDKSREAVQDKVGHVGMKASASARFDEHEQHEHVAQAQLAGGEKHEVIPMHEMTERERVQMWLHNSFDTVREVNKHDRTLGDHDNVFCCRRMVHDQCKATDEEAKKMMQTAAFPKMPVENDKRIVKGPRGNGLQEKNESDGETEISCVSRRSRATTCITSSEMSCK